MPDDRGETPRVPSWRRYLRFWGARVAEDVDAEFRFHLEMRVQENLARGLSEGDARAEATRRLGDLERARASCRAIGYRRERKEARVDQLDSLVQDLRIVARTLARSKAWTAVAVLTLALGIGATTAIFTVVNAVLLRPLPYPHQERLVVLSEAKDGENGGVVSNHALAAWIGSARSLTHIAVRAPTSRVVRGVRAPEEVRGERVTASYFAVLGIPARRGRTFVAAEDRAGGPDVVVLSDQLWRAAFAADTSLIGRRILMEGQPYTVVGVMPPEFTTTSGPTFWIPMRLSLESAPGSIYYYFTLARLADGATLDQARRELAAISARSSAGWPEGARGTMPMVQTLHEYRFGDTRPPLTILFAGVGVLLLIACANVSNLLLARAARRQKEFAVRVALGASRWRLVRYLLCESLVLSITGALVGLTLPAVMLRRVMAIAPSSIARVENIHVDGVVLTFTLGLAVITGAVFGLVPALEAGRGELSRALAAGSARATASPGQRRLRRALIVLELGTALVLVTSAGLLARSFARVLAIDPGFRPDHVLSMRLSLPMPRYTDSTAGALYESLRARALALPGVRSVALADVAPMGGARMSVQARDREGRETPVMDVIGVGPSFFSTVGARLSAGRAIDERDRAGAAPVAVINTKAARSLFPHQDPIGKTIPMYDGGGVVVIGVASDIVRVGLESGAMPTIYRPADQIGATPYMTLLIRADGDADALPRPLQQIVRTLDPGIPVPRITALEAAIADSVAPRRFSATLIAVLALLSATLAAIGLYGVMYYLVEDRTREIGIRIALGAARGEVIRLVMGQGMGVVLPGLALGVLGSFAAVRLLRAMLFGVGIYDPWAFTGAAALLLVVALAACWLPARRASRIDPVLAFRAEG